MKTILVVALVAVGLALIGSAVIPALPCPECKGMSADWRDDRGGPPRPESAVWIGCPRCFDGGRVTPFNRTKRRILSERACRLIEGSMDGYSAPELEGFLKARTLESTWHGDARPIQVNGASFVLIALQERSVTVPGWHDLRYLLLDASGSLKDQAEVRSSDPKVVLESEFVDPPRDDGVVVRIRQTNVNPSPVVKRVGIRDGRLRVAEGP